MEPAWKTASSCPPDSAGGPRLHNTGNGRLLLAFPSAFRGGVSIEAAAEELKTGAC